ncbi:MAG: transcriptional repressor [Bdellovibrio sp.]
MIKKSNPADEKTDHLLTAFDLKKTPLRRGLLQEFLKSKEALTQGDLLQRLAQKLESVDRVTLYRNLSQFKELGIIHEVSVNSYIFCEHNCDKHPHLLLFCQTCHRHEEVSDHTKIQSVLEALNRLRFFSTRESVSIKGLCSTCAR